MMRPRARRPSAVWLAAAAGIGFLTGVIAMSVPPRMVPAGVLVAENRVERLREPVATPHDATVAPAPPAAAASLAPDAAATPTIGADPIEDLRQRHLDLPVEGLKRASLRDTFSEQRGTARHEALDILAPRDTPVIAVEDGTIAKLFLSKPGGITIYQFDPSGTYAYYYAHLARYADGLKEGMPIERGQTIGYVGTTGNAPPETPHLHFAIFKLTDEKRWWKGTAIDPYPILR